MSHYKFTVEINLGNSEAQTFEDIRGMLQTVIERTREHSDPPRPTHSRRIHDVNGNTVGSYNVEQVTECSA